jgi:hypothetical protein
MLYVSNEDQVKTRFLSFWAQFFSVSEKRKLKKTLWPEPVSELYRLSDYRLSAKLVRTFADGGRKGNTNH